MPRLRCEVCNVRDVEGAEMKTGSEGMQTGAVRRPKIVVLYPFYPHYRAPIMRALAASANYEYEFLGDRKGVGGIESYTGEGDIVIHPLRSRAAPGH